MSYQRTRIGDVSGAVVGGAALTGALLKVLVGIASLLLGAVGYLFGHLIGEPVSRLMINRWYRNQSASHCSGRRELAAVVRDSTRSLAARLSPYAEIRCQRLIAVADHVCVSVRTAYALENFLDWAPREGGHPRTAGDDFVREEIAKVLVQADCLEYEGDLKSKLLIKEVRLFRQTIVDAGLDIADVDAARRGREGGCDSRIWRTPFGRVLWIAAVQSVFGMGRLHDRFLIALAGSGVHSAFGHPIWWNGD